jgi:hypothetical protein
MSRMHTVHGYENVRNMKNLFIHLLMVNIGITLFKFGDFQEPYPHITIAQNRSFIFSPGS